MNEVDSTCLTHIQSLLLYTNNDNQETSRRMNASKSRQSDSSFSPGGIRSQVAGQK